MGKKRHISHKEDLKRKTLYKQSSLKLHSSQFLSINLHSYFLKEWDTGWKDELYSGGKPEKPYLSQGIMVNINNNNISSLYFGDDVMLWHFIWVIPSQTHNSSLIMRKNIRKKSSWGKPTKYLESYSSKLSGSWKVNKCLRYCQNAEEPKETWWLTM